MTTVETNNNADHRDGIDNGPAFPRSPTDRQQPNRANPGNPSNLPPNLATTKTRGTEAHDQAIQAIGHVRIGSVNLDDWSDFATNQLG